MVGSQPLPLLFDVYEWEKRLCEGEACQGSAPLEPHPGSWTYEGQGNPRPGRCPKGKRKVKRKGKGGLREEAP